MFRALTSLVFAAVFSAKLIGQTPGDSTLAAAYNQALSDRLNVFRCFFGQEKWIFYSNFLKPEHLNETNRVYFEVVSETNLISCRKRIFISRKPKEVYFIWHKNFQGAQDTVDILITQQFIRCLKRNRIGIASGCRGTMGYIPDGRLIFNREKNLWEIIPFKVLYENALAQQQELLKKMSKKR